MLTLRARAAKVTGVIINSRLATRQDKAQETRARA